ncbi:MAG: ABC transporter ATP-binding protein [Chloroflexi bacterium HGW-Chloroflexi-10]|nr:MAG: ABC transporter ATP-binding protein [Chloroflexi bacterium HGW-Chloroflexi-10]
MNQPTSEAIISLQDVNKVFQNGSIRFAALKEINAHFYPGEFVSVVGRSGSGKSTLANMITGIDHPTTGAVLINGTAIHKLNESKMSIWRGRNLGIVFQFFQLMPTLTILENVLLPMDLTEDLPLVQREQRAMELLAMVELNDFCDQYPDQVSTGQQQSAAIARALANDPPILIADEPTGNLDSRTAETIFGIFVNLVQQGKTIIMVTHDNTLAKRTDRVLRISDGCLLDPTQEQ